MFRYIKKNLLLNSKNKRLNSSVAGCVSDGCATKPNTHTIDLQNYQQTNKQEEPDVTA